MRRIVARTDDDQVVLEPGLRIHGVAVGHEIDDGVAGMHGDQVRLPFAKGVGDDVLGPHGDDLDLVAVPGGLLESLRQGLPESGFDHAADDRHADLLRMSRQDARTVPHPASSASEARQPSDRQGGTRVYLQLTTAHGVCLLLFLCLHCVLSELARVQRACSKARSVSDARN